MYYCTPTAGERFFLQLLLTVVRGPTLFENLKTVNGVVYSTFREAYQALHLVEDDQEWFKCFSEAVEFVSGSSLRSLFVSALLFQELNEPKSLWDRFCLNICDNLDVRIAQLGLLNQLCSDDTSNAFHQNLPKLDYGLYLLEQALIDAGKALTDFNMPGPLFQWRSLMEQSSTINSNVFIQAEVAYYRNVKEQNYQQKISMMNISQKAVFDEIIDIISSNPNTAHFFLKGPAGTGKTFVYNTLCHYFRRQGKIVVCVPSSGIASLLLPGGRTSHSRFKIPLNTYPDSVCLIKKNSDLAAMLRQCSLIIWDEIPMQHRHCFEAVSRTLLKFRLALWWYPCCLGGGNFAQIGPVVKHGQHHHIVEASLAKSIEIWQNLKKLKLTENMLLSGSNPIDQSFSQWIVDEINRYVLEQLPGNKTSLFAVDCITQEDSTGSEDHQIPTEYLQSLNPHGLPLSVLELTIGTPVMILRNINAENGLCNGTRVTVLSIGEFLLKIKLPGVDGSVEVIPRFTLSTL
ncbi:hypothetical protein G6F47_010255 [Rhizopus delemar]|nr:hypothetical protein G6F54_008083 [Rhizopus delemar]KAG1510719.1 hypothetical protein G6F53_006473 [Rhizopus delemar]KAG1589749.1 hypothetical protein G6F47_010255 [Rhizopus delemar]